MRQHLKTTTHQPKLARAIKKYGWENINKEILIICDNSKILYDYEKLYIKELNSIDFGYNCTTGGEYTTMSEEIRQKHKEYNALPEVKKRKSEELKRRLQDESDSMHPKNRKPMLQETRERFSAITKSRMQKGSEFYNKALTALHSNEEQRLRSIRSPEAKLKKQATLQKKRELGIEGKHSWKVKLLNPETNTMYSSIRRCAKELQKTEKMVRTMIKNKKLLRVS
jgi:group I intron endonuclease